MAFPYGPLNAYHMPWSDYNQVFFNSQAQLAARIDRLTKANEQLKALVLEVQDSRQVISEEYEYLYGCWKAESAEVERLKKANAQLANGLSKVNAHGLLSEVLKLEKETLDVVRLAEGLKSRVEELEVEKLEEEAEAQAEIDGLKFQIKELEEENLMMQANTNWLESLIEDLKKEKFEFEVATIGLRVQIGDLEREKSEAQDASNVLKLRVEELEKTKLELEADARSKKLRILNLEEISTELIEQLQSERSDSEERLDNLTQKNSDLRVQIHKLEASGLDLEIKYLQSESLVKDSEERYANKNMEVEKMKVEISELEKKLENLEDEENRLKTANDTLSLQNCDLHETLHSHMETIERQRSQILKVKDCSNAALRDSNNTLVAFERFLEVALLMLQATLERVKTGKSVEEDKMSEDILESLSREETKEQAVAFVEGLQAIEVVFMSKEEKIKELEKELLLSHDDWLFVKDKLPI